MKRNMDLVRKLLFEIEKTELGDRIPSFFKVEGYQDDDCMYHIYLLHDAGLIRGEKMDPYAGVPRFSAITLRWAGHDFIEQSRDDTKWEKAMSIMGQVKSFTLETASSILAQLIKTEVGEHF